MFTLRCDSKGNSDKINEWEAISMKCNEGKGNTNESQTNEIVIEVEVIRCGIHTN